VGAPENAKFAKSTITQPCKRPAVLKFHMLVPRGFAEATKLSKSTSGQIQVADGTQISNIYILYISGKAKVRDFRFGMYINCVE